VAKRSAPNGAADARTPAPADPLAALDTSPLVGWPLGLYVADAAGRLLFANPMSRELLGLPASGPLDGRIGDFLAEADWPGLMAAAEGPAHVRSGRKQVLTLRVGEGERAVEHYLSALPRGEGEKALYAGGMVDVTEEQAAAQQAERLQRAVRDLTFDIGQILHANTATLVMVNQTLQAAERALAPELAEAEDAPHPDDLQAALVASSQRLAAQLVRFVEAGDPERRAAALPDERWDALARSIAVLEEPERIDVPELRIPTLRTAGAEAGAAVRKLEPGHMPRELVREVARAASELERLACFIDIQATRTTVVQMDTSLAALRDFVTSEIRSPEAAERVPVASLVRAAMAQLAAFSRAARVEIQWTGRSEEHQVRGDVRDLQRTVTNLLHNAIKYSWRREGYDAPWVTVDISGDEDWVSLEIENWGVPVERREIEQELVFNLGYRGKRSKDRGRLGTGIGLTDSRRVAERHGGRLELSSRPARSPDLEPGDRDYYKQPFLTRVRLRLPAAH